MILIYIQDRSGNTLGVLDNYYDDKHIMVLESGVSTYEFTVNKDEKDSEFISRGNYLILEDDNGEPLKFTIMNIEESHSELKVSCDSLGLELLNKVRNSWQAPATAQPAKYYIEKALAKTGWSIGVNEISNLSRKLSWEGRDTALKRLLSICTEFDHAEVEFKVEILGMKTVRQVVNIRKARGSKRDISLVYSDTVNDIVKTTDIMELATALEGVGGTITQEGAPEGTPEKHVDFAALTYDDGYFFTPAGDPMLYARVANRQFNITENYEEDFYDYDTQSSRELLNRTLGKLKELSEPKINYTVDLAVVDTTLKLGDTVTIVDHDYQPELLLQARVLSLEKSYTDPVADKVTFGNYLIIYSSIPERLKQLQEQLKNIKIPNNFTWTRYAEDANGKGMTAAPNIRTTHVAFLSNQKTGVPSDDPADYAGHWVLVKGPKGDKGADGDDGVAGKDGVGVKATVITYAQSTSGTTPPTASWTASVPTLIKGQYLWTKTVWTYTDSDTETGYTVSYNAKDGNTGSDGRAGKDGTGIKSTVIEYVGAVSGTSKPASGWSTTIPTVPAGQYLWTRTTWQYTDGTSEQGYTNALMGRTGAAGRDGVAGKDGVGIKSTQIMYAQSISGTTAPTTGWATQVPTLIKGQYLWTQTTWLYTDNTGEAGYTVSYNAKDGNTGSDGRAGKDGVGIKSTTITYQSGTSGTVQPTGTWVSNPPSVPGGNYLWTRTVWSYTDGTNETGYSVAKAGEKGAEGAPGRDGVAGKDGVGIKSTTVTYQASVSGTTAPTGAWVASPTAVAGQYQWTRTLWTYTDGTTEVGYSVGHIGANGATGKDGVAGKPGVGIKSTTITYQASTSGTTAPTGTWVSSPPSVPGGNYLWTRTIWSYTDNTSETGYSVAKAGEKGNDGKDGVAGKDGLGIKSTVIAYQLSSSGTVTPTGTWSATVPALTKGQYLWTRTTLTYTDNSSEPVYSVSYVAKDGNNGANGVAGKDGVGIKSTTITYATSTSGTSAPTSGWVSTPPSAAAGQFIWTRTIWTYTDNTTETGYSVGKIGEKGDKGDTGQGIPGTPGTDGRTPYLHTAWANSFNGKDGFSTDVSTNKSYMGTYVNFTEADPTDPALYNWIELVGALEIGGINLIIRHDELKNKMIGPSGEVENYNDSSVTKAVVSVKPGNALTMTRYNSAPDNNFRFAFYDASGSVIKRGYTADSPHIEEAPPKSATFRISYGTGLIVKLERGRKSSEYTPAPEDAQQQIDTINQGLRDTNSKIAAVTKIDRQATAPTNPKKGDQWWVLSKDPTTGKDSIEAFKQWSGTQWEDAPIQQSAMNIGTLNGNVINGATINGSEFTNSFNYTGIDKIHFRGVTQIKDGAVNITWKITENNQTGDTTLNANGLESIVRDPKGTIIRSARLQMGELQLADSRVSGWLNEQDVYQNYTNQVQYLDGWYGWNNPISITRRGKMVTFSGYIAHNGGSAHINIAQFPAWARPEHNEFIVEVHFAGDTGERTNGYGNLMLSTGGRLIINRGLGTGQHASFGYTFVGQDI